MVIDVLESKVSSDASDESSSRSAASPASRASSARRRRCVSGKTFSRALRFAPSSRHRIVVCNRRVVAARRSRRGVVASRAQRCRASAFVVRRVLSMRTTPSGDDMCGGATVVNGTIWAGSNVPFRPCRAAGPRCAMVDGPRRDGERRRREKENAQGAGGRAAGGAHEARGRRQPARHTGAEGPKRAR